MKVRLVNLIYDETSAVLANGEIKPAQHCKSINEAKEVMRKATWPKRSFEAWRDIGPQPHERLIKLTGAQRPAPPAPPTRLQIDGFTAAEALLLRGQAEARADEQNNE